MKFYELGNFRNKINFVDIPEDTVFYYVRKIHKLSYKRHIELFCLKIIHQNKHLKWPSFGLLYWGSSIFGF